MGEKCRGRRERARERASERASEIGRGGERGKERGREGGSELGHVLLVLLISDAAFKGASDPKGPAGFRTSRGGAFQREEPRTQRDRSPCTFGVYTVDPRLHTLKTLKSEP
eukprot:3940333-Rhodomonas_salina.4